MRTPWLFLVLLVACGEPQSGNGPPEEASALDLDDAQAVFDAALAGEVDAAFALQHIANGPGWPLLSDGVFLFACLDDGEGPYRLAGDHNDWAQSAMRHAGDIYYAEVTITTPNGSLYKLVSDARGFHADPLARSFGFDEHGEYSLVRPGAGGRFERWVGLEAEDVTPRDLLVRVPAATALRHLYVHDGQNLFDPTAPSGGWSLDTSVGPSTLAVGITAPGTRLHDYTHVPDVVGGSLQGGGGDAYADFIEEIVRPHIERTYGVPEVRGVLGASLGGLIALHQAERHPGVFDFVGSMSGSLGWGSWAAANETIIERYGRRGCGPSVYYLDSGGGPGSGCVDLDGDGTADDASGASDSYCETRQMADVLAQSGCVWDATLHHWYEPGAGHHEQAWRERLFRPLGVFEAL